MRELVHDTQCEVSQPASAAAHTVNRCKCALREKEDLYASQLRLARQVVALIAGEFGVHDDTEARDIVKKAEE